MGKDFICNFLFGEVLVLYWLIFDPTEKMPDRQKTAYISFTKTRFSSIKKSIQKLQITLLQIHIFAYAKNT